MKKIKNRIMVAFLITSSVFLILIGVFTVFNLVQLNDTETQTINDLLYNDYDLLIKNEVETAESVISGFYEQYSSGIITEEEAKAQAKLAIRALRYGEEGYFWIDDTQGILVVHPMLPEQEGRNRIDIKDPQGVELIKEILSAAKDNKNSGYTNFMWEKPQDVGTGKLSPKRAFSKLFQPWGWVVSTGNYVDNIALTITDKEKDLFNNLVKNIVGIAVFILVSFIAVAFVSIVLSRRISVPLVKIVKAFKKDQNGKISIKEIEVTSRDEIGLLSATLNELSAQMRSFIEGVMAESELAASSAGSVENAVLVLGEEIREISSTTQEISAGMEETAASSEEMSSATTEIAAFAGAISSKASEASASVDVISMRAGSLKTSLQEAVEKGSRMLRQVRVRLDSAILEAKSVAQINELANAILQITSQTNLLALNAAIEAARAGEAGRGFSVVAEEIRTLAEDSKRTASRIQSIIKVVNGSVDNLSESAKELMGFMENSVNEDYTLMLKASDDYNTDACDLKERISDFYQTAEKLHVSINNIVKAIEGVAHAAGEGAEGANEIVKRVLRITEKSDDLMQNARASNNSSENLLELVSKFKL